MPYEGDICSMQVFCLMTKMFFKKIVIIQIFLNNQK